MLQDKCFGRNWPVFNIDLMKAIYAVTLILWCASCLGEPIRVACVGDSITYGYPEAETGGYPKMLQKLLGEEYTVSNFGSNGATVLKKSNIPYWNLAIYKDALSFSPNIVVIMFGTNDGKTYNWEAGRDNYSTDYAAMINSFKELPSKPKILINTPPPIYSNNKYKDVSAANIKDEVVPAVHKIAKDNNVLLVDIYNICGGDKMAYPDWFPDGIHLTQDGLLAIAKGVFSIIQQSTLKSTEANQTSITTTKPSSTRQPSTKLPKQQHQRPDPIHTLDQEEPAQEPTSSFIMWAIGFCVCVVVGAVVWRVRSPQRQNRGKMSV